jgi:hypothetical protein
MKAHLPAPTVWPAALATGATLLAAGLITSWFVSLAGAVLMVAALVGWISLLLDEEHG